MTKLSGWLSGMITHKEKFAQSNSDKAPDLVLCVYLKWTLSTTAHDHDCTRSQFPNETKIRKT